MRKEHIAYKHGLVEALRQEDAKRKQERLDRHKLLREERFNRLLENVTDVSGPPARIAYQIMERDQEKACRRRQLHDVWLDQVYQPLQDQAHRHLNPTNRRLSQRLRGSKSVDFLLPEPEPFKLRVPSRDPTKEAVRGRAREMAFHQAACAVLGTSRSAPELGALMCRSPASRSPPRRCVQGMRPTVDMALTGQAHVEAAIGLLRGHERTAYDPGDASRMLRGGAGAHLPDEGDGVPCAGKRRLPGGRDGAGMGILAGGRAANGESSLLKTASGTSCGAPAQDHFEVDRSSRTLEAEFPKGKRCFPARASRTLDGCVP